MPVGRAGKVSTSPAKNPLNAPKKCVVLGVFGHLPKISKCPCAKNIIDTAFSFEDRSGATMFFEHVNFQPRASKAQKNNFSKRPLSKGIHKGEAGKTRGPG
jgi:hypothetical protein